MSLDDNSDIIYMHSDKDINLNPPKRFQILKSYILKLPKFIIRNLLLIKFLKNNFLEEGNWSSDVLSNVKERLGSWKPDLIISSFSPIDSHYIASKLRAILIVIGLLSTEIISHITLWPSQYGNMNC